MVIVLIVSYRNPLHSVPSVPTSCPGYSTMMHATSHSILLLFPTRESCVFSLSATLNNTKLLHTVSLGKKIPLLLSLFTRSFLKSKPSFTANPDLPVFLSTSSWLHLSFFKHCFPGEFWPACWLRYRSMFQLSALVAPVLYCLFLGFPRGKKLCVGDEIMPLFSGWLLGSRMALGLWHL